MSSYVYRVTGKSVKLTDGTIARLAVYAYKPAFGYGTGIDEFNRRAAKKGGVMKSRAFIRRGVFNGVIVMSEKAGEPVYLIPPDQATFYDDAVACDEFTIQDVQVAA